MKDKKKRILILGALTALVLACILLIVLNSCSSCDGEHSWGEWEVLEEATCAQEGEQAHTCRRCRKTESEAIPTFEHEPANTLDSGETRHWNACKACDAKCNAEYHEYREWEVVEEATCDKDGSRKRVCKVCKHEDVEVIPALGHTASEGWSIDKNKHYHTCTVCGGRVKVEIHQYDKMTTVKKATEGEDGLQTGKCTVCNYNGSKVLTRTGATSITFNSKHSVTVGGTLQLSATVGPNSVADKSVTWSSLNKDVATVTKDGKLTAHKLGRVNVVAKAANGYEEVFAVYVTEAVIDGNLNDKCYGKTETFNWMDRDYNIGENTSIYFGKDGLYLADRVSDDKVQGNGDTSRIETFITLSDVFSMTDTFVVRYYPNGYSKTGSNIRVFEYENANSKYRFRELEAKNKDLPDISAEIKYTNGGYDIEAFIPWSMFELTKAPAKIYYQSVGCARYGSSSAMKYATYEEGIKKYTESGIYEIENYIEYDKLGFVYKEVVTDKETIVMGNESIVDGAYTTEFYMHKLNDLNPLTGAKFSGTGSKYVKELGNGYYRLAVPVSEKAKFEETQTITIVDTRKLGETFTLRIFDGTLVNDLAITYGGVPYAPVLYGTESALDMSRFSTATENTAALDYEWTLTYDGEELDVDMSKEFEFTQPGEYVLTAEITTDGYAGSASMVINVLTPNVYVSYTGAKIRNEIATTPRVQPYVLNGKAFKQVNANTASFTKGINGDSKGAIATNHNSGVYTKVNNYKLGTDDFTISTWVNIPVGQTTSTGSSSYVFGTDQPDAKEGFAISYFENSKDFGNGFRIRLNGSTERVLDVVLERGEWYNITLMREGGKIKLYLDGEQLAAYNIASDYDFGGVDIAFGAYENFAYDYHNGYVYFDDVQIYGGTLTEDQLGAIAGIDEIPAEVTQADPVVNVTYKGGKVENTVEDSNLTVGAYKLSSDKKKFETTSAAFTTGMDGDKKGALYMTHRDGAYTVVKDYKFGTNDFTISTWFNVPADLSSLSSGSGTYLFGNSQPDDTASGTFSVCIKHTIKEDKTVVDELRFRVNGKNADPTPKISYESGAWNNVVLVREGDVLKLYFNGELLNTTILAAKTNFGSKKDLAFGAYTNNPNNYHGNTMYYDNIQVFDQALTDEFVKENIFEVTTTVSEPAIDINYTGGTITNEGTAQNTVGAYKVNAANNGFEAGTPSYTTGRDGSANGAFVANHKNGPYTVVKGYNFGTNDFTVSTWFNVPNAGSLATGSKANGTYIMGTTKVDNPDDGFRITLRRNGADNKFELQFKADDKYNSLRVFPEFEYNKWNNLVVTREGNTLSLYANGTRVEVLTLSDNVNFGTKDLSFGGYYSETWGYQDANMYYDDIKVYNAALTTKQIKTEILGEDGDAVNLALSVDYTGGSVVNGGTNSALTVGAYKLNASKLFESVAQPTFTTGRDGSANGAIVTNHKNGPYTVVKGYPFGLDDFTVSAWINIPNAGSLSTGNGTYIMGTTKVDNTTDGFRITLRRNSADNKFEFQFRAAGSTTGLKEFVGFEYGKWHHLVVVREGGMLTLYVDGKWIHSETFNETVDLKSKALSFGGYEGESWSYQDASIYYDDIKIYDGAMTPTQIRNIK